MVVRSFQKDKGAFVVQKTESKLTVFFDDPFWVGVYERIYEGELEVCKITFGAEPKDSEVYEFFINNFNKLSFCLSVRVNEKPEAKVSPKRMHRKINKQLDSSGIGTKSQKALKLQQEAGKTLRKKTKQKRDNEKQLKFELKKQKHREKHMGL